MSQRLSQTPSHVRSNICKSIVDRDSFNDRRGLAIDRPDRARNKLGPYAALKLNIVKARRLIAADIHGSSDPYVNVYVDDILKASTPHIKLNLNPVWNWKGDIEIYNPASVVLLQVFDYDFGVKDADLLGFVEFPVADLPLGSSVKGWFQLSPAEQLTATAPERLEKSLIKKTSEECGAVFLDMTLDVTSGDQSDEHYAWCLQKPEFHMYPMNGYDPTRFNAQALIDNIMEIKSGIMEHLINPMFACIAYVLSWQETWLSLLVLLSAVGVSIRPELYLSGILGTCGIFLLALSSPTRRSAIVAHPSTVPLSDEGFRLVAKMGSTDMSLAFILRVVAVLQGQVLDQDKLRAFAAFSSFDGEPVCDFMSLKRQLLESAKTTEPFLQMKGPLPPNSLIKRQDMRGKIVKCLNPEDELSWRYLVTFDSDKTEHEFAADELEPRMDMRFLMSPVVLAVVPDAVENAIGAFQPTFENLNRSVSSAWQPMAQIFSWAEPRKSLGLATGCLVLSFAFIWIQRPVLVLVSIWMFFHSAAILKRAAMHRHAKKMDIKHASKSYKSWAFFIQATSDELAPGSNDTKSLFDFLGTCGIRQRSTQ